MTASDLVAQSDRCLANTVSYMVRHGDGGAAEEKDGLILFAGSRPYPGPYCNGAIRLDPTLGVDALLARGRSFFAPRRRGFIIWARAGADMDIIDRCRKEGWHERPPVEGMPIIRLERHRLQLPGDIPAEVPAVRFIRTEAEARAYLHVLAEAYGLGDAPTTILGSIFCSPAAMLDTESTAAVVEVDGHALAGSMAIVVNGMACSLFTATAPAARRRGLGSLCLMAVLDAVFGAGISSIYAQSSQMGLRRWLEMGFEVIGQYHRFLVPPPR